MTDARVRCAFFLPCFLFPSVAGAQTRPATMEEMHRLHQNPKEYIATLDDPARDAYQRPVDVVKALGLKEGDVVADIGAGSGYFTFRFARHVGASGRVYAIDVSPDMILHMNRRARDLGAGNVRTLLVPDARRVSTRNEDRARGGRPRVRAEWLPTRRGAHVSSVSVLSGLPPHHRRRGINACGAPVSSGFKQAGQRADCCRPAPASS